MNVVVMSVAQLFGNFFAGRILDRLDIFKVRSICTFSYLVIFLVYAFAPGLWACYIAVFLMGLTISMAGLTYSLGVLEFSGEGQGSMLMGAHTFVTGIAGFIAGIFLAPRILDAIGDARPTVMFLIGAAIFLPGAIFLAFHRSATTKEKGATK